MEKLTEGSQWLRQEVDLGDEAQQEGDSEVHCRQVYQVIVVARRVGESVRQVEGNTNSRVKSTEDYLTLASIYGVKKWVSVTWCWQVAPVDRVVVNAPSSSAHRRNCRT